MKYDFSSLEAFAKQFAGNWRFFPGFIWTRNDIADPEQWGIIYTKNSQSTPLEIVNAEHLKHLLWVYLHHKSKKRKQKHVHHIRDRHFAAGLTEGFLIRVYDAGGEVTNACATLYDHLSALRDYPVADDEALDRLEAEIFAEEWPEILKSIIAHFDGEHHPVIDGEYRYYVNLKALDDIGGIERLFLKHNPRDYWSSDTGYFDMSNFLDDITDGRITFDEIFFACPDNVCLNFSAVLVNYASPAFPHFNLATYKRATVARYALPHPKGKNHGHERTEYHRHHRHQRSHSHADPRFPFVALSPEQEMRRYRRRHRRTRADHRK